MSRVAAADLAAKLTPRDRALLGTLARLRVASTDQLYRLHFAGAHRQAGYRCLWRLSRLGLIRRLDRRIGGITPGSSSAIYSLDILGQRLMDSAGPAGGARLQRPWTPSSPYLRHAVLVSEVYVLAVDITRDNPALKLTEFQGEPQCWRAAPVPSDYLKPDAFLVLRGAQYEDSYFIEVDCGTESSSAIGRKLAAYESYWRSGAEQTRNGVFPRVLFVVMNEARQQQLGAIIHRRPASSNLFGVVVMAQLPTYLINGAGES